MPDSSIEPSFHQVHTPIAMNTNTATIDSAVRTVLFPNTTRGRADHGWLKANHSFSFANFYNPQRMGFGTLLVLNEDYVAPDRGFNTHPHDNMEIVTIVLEGAIAHKDSEGNQETVPAGEVQYMRAGTGVRHSEFNPSRTDTLHLFQIWILPRERGLQPGYGQSQFPASARQGVWQRVVSPDGSEGSLQKPMRSSIARSFNPAAN
jgi:hypothetical protein